MQSLDSYARLGKVSAARYPALPKFEIERELHSAIFELLDNNTDRHNKLPSTLLVLTQPTFSFVSCAMRMLN